MKKPMSTATKVILIVGSLGVLFVLFVGSILFVVTRVMRSSDVFVTAVRAASENAEVASACQGPVVAGMLMSGSIQTTNGSGTADIEIPFDCPRTKGRIHAVGTKSNDLWTYTTLDVRLNGEDRNIDVRTPQ